VVSSNIGYPHFLFRRSLTERSSYYRRYQSELSHHAASFGETPEGRDKVSKIAPDFLESNANYIAFARLGWEFVVKLRSLTDGHIYIQSYVEQCLQSEPLQRMWCDQPLFFQWLNRNVRMVQPQFCLWPDQLELWFQTPASVQGATWLYEGQPCSSPNTSQWEFRSPYLRIPVPLQVLS